MDLGSPCRVLDQMTELAARLSSGTRDPTEKLARAPLAASKVASDVAWAARLSSGTRDPTEKLARAPLAASKVASEVA